MTASRQASQLARVPSAVLSSEASEQPVPRNQTVDRLVENLKSVESENGDVMLSYAGNRTMHARGLHRGTCFCIEIAPHLAFCSWLIPSTMFTCPLQHHDCSLSKVGCKF